MTRVLLSRAGNLGGDWGRGVLPMKRLNYSVTTGEANFFGGQGERAGIASIPVTRGFVANTAWQL